MATSPTVRPATADDTPFLAAMLAVAADWRPGTVVRPVDEILAIPALGHYVAGWPRPDDHGLVAEGTDRGGGRRQVGAAWWRLFPPTDPGYGFVDDATPEISIGVLEAWRGQGIGEQLLRRLAQDAWRTGLLALCLSVERGNPAVRLYARCGFETVETPDSDVDLAGALTMVLRRP